MSVQIRSGDQLCEAQCAPCEGGVDRFDAETAAEQVRRLDGWALADDHRRIRKEWETSDFPAAIRFFDRVAELAEGEGHHPDLHLTGYRRVAIELTTHAIGGLSENDFILAAKIDRLPVERRSGD